jgi:hypothetical protein
MAGKYNSPKDFHFIKFFQIFSTRIVKHKQLDELKEAEEGNIQERANRKNHLIET